jgi:AcrR family transcriptional regulator
LLDDGIPYADLSVEQIARKAGRSRSMFYVHFRDKRDLLLYATQEIAAQLDAVAAGWLRESDGDGNVRDALERILSIYRQHPGLIAAVVEASGYDERVREHWRELMGRFVAATEHRLAGESPMEDASSAAATHALAFALVWMTERACYQQLTGGGGDDEDALVDALAGIWERSASPGHTASRGVPAPARQKFDARRPARGTWGSPSATRSGSSSAVTAATARRARRQPFQS